jgi:uncharacterized membrane protein YfcA
MEVLSPAQYVYLFVVLSTAYFVRGATGFGSGLIAIPLLLMWLPLTLAVPLVVALDYLASAVQGIGNGRAVDWREIWPLLPFALVGVVGGILLLRTLDATILLRILAVFLILIAVYGLAAKTPEGGGSRWWAIPAGIGGGLVGSAFGTGGPFYVAYLQLRGLDKTRFRATFATIFLMDGGSRLVGYILSGLVTGRFLVTLGAMLPVAMGGIYLGGKLHARVSQQVFGHGINILLILSGLMLLAR